MTQIQTPEYPAAPPEAVVEDHHRSMATMIGHIVLGTANFFNPIRHRPGKFGGGVMAGLVLAGGGYLAANHFNNGRANDTVTDALADQAQHPTIVESKVDFIKWDYRTKIEIVSGKFSATTDARNRQYPIDSPLFKVIGFEVGDDAFDIRRNEEVSVTGTTDVEFNASAITQERTLDNQRLRLSIDASQLAVQSLMDPTSGDVSYYNVVDGKKVYNGGMNFKQAFMMQRAMSAAEVQAVKDQMKSYLLNTLPGPDWAIGWLIDRAFKPASSELLNDITTLSNRSRQELTNQAVSTVEQNCFTGKESVLKDLMAKSVNDLVMQMGLSDRVAEIKIINEPPALKVPEPAKIPDNGEDTRAGDYDAFLMPIDPRNGTIVVNTLGTCPTQLSAKPASSSPANK